jgi:Secretion system C-terminal sorting domain
MKLKLLLVLGGLVCTTLGFAQSWNFQFRARDMNNNILATSNLDVWTQTSSGFHSLGMLDLSATVCEGQQIKLETMSNSTGVMDCMSGANTITGSTLWDVVYGDILAGAHPSNPYTYPIFVVQSSYILNNNTWPVSPGVTITIPVNSEPHALGTSSNSNNLDPNYVIYRLGIAPVMGCKLAGVYSASAGCMDLLFLDIKVRRAADPLTDVTVCPGSTVTNSQLGLATNATVSSWSPYDPRTTGVNTTTTFTCTLSNANGCTITDNVVVTVNQPDVPLFNNPSTTLCSTQLPFYSNDPYQSGTSYSITVNGVLVFDQGGIIVPSYFVNDLLAITTSGTYNIVYQYYTPQGTLCSKNYTIIVGVNKLGAGSDITICKGSSATINFTTSTWPVTVYQAGNPIATLTSSPYVVTPTATTTYTLVNTSTGICPAASDNITINVIDLDPNFNYSYNVAGSVASLTATAVNNTLLNTWELYKCTDILGSNPVYLATQTTQTANFTNLPVMESGAVVYYKLCHTSKYLKSLPCPKTTCKIVGGTQKFAGITSEEDAEMITPEPEISVSPNPTNGKFIIDFAGTKAQQVIVFNSLGAVIYKQDVTDLNRMEIDLGNFPTGLYLTHILSGDEVILKRIEKN